MREVILFHLYCIVCSRACKIEGQNEASWDALNFIC